MGVVQSPMGVVQFYMGIVQSSMELVQSSMGVVQSAMGVVQTLMGLIHGLPELPRTKRISFVHFCTNGFVTLPLNSNLLLTTTTLSFLFP
jgi:hypothetical protein